MCRHDPVSWATPSSPLARTSVTLLLSGLGNQIQYKGKRREGNGDQGDSESHVKQAPWPFRSGPRSAVKLPLQTCLLAIYLQQTMGMNLENSPRDSAAAGDTPRVIFEMKSSTCIICCTSFSLAQHQLYSLSEHIVRPSNV